MPSSSHHGTFTQDYTMLKRLGKAKFCVYLARQNYDGKLYAVKFFPFEDGKQNICYSNEKNYDFLDNEHCIKINQTNDMLDVIQKGQVQHASAIIMEYAPFGDFYDMMITKKVQFEDKLARTYLH
mmetsp:Transcript_79619/g.110618  ORF Transcript_79619/g.110618 Transcript_79619/m.110618 type:complete len:125 (+) Transcript_79619:58-432(+)